MKHSSIQIKDIQGNYCTIASEDLIAAANHHIQTAFSNGLMHSSPASAASYLQSLIGHYDHEVFYALWLNSQHQVIHHGELFRGTIDSASIYPREVVKAGLACNAAAVIFAHNHPSGHAEPSSADIGITKRLKESLSLVDIRLLDHFVIGSDTTSMMERGLL
jgi:DNA repair protein RadC